MARALKSAGSALGRVNQQLFGGGSSHSKQQSGLDPRFFDMFAGNLARATGVAESLGPRQFADFTPDFWAGAQALRDTVSGPAMGTTNNAVAMAQQAGRFTPQDVTAGAFPSGDLDAYLNPYTSAVVDTALADLDRQRQIQQQQIGHSATQAGAFGGSRHGVAEAETNRAFADIGARTAAGLRQQGFDSAANLMQQDMNRRLQAQLANQQAGLAGNQQALAAAGLLGSLGAQQQQLGLQGAGALLGLGQMLQGHEQARLDAIRNLPLEQQAIINEALGINPGGGSGMQSSGRSQSDRYDGAFSGFNDLLGGLLTLSDPRVKDDAKRIEDGLAAVRELHGYTYRYKGSERITGGVMADEVEKVLPGAVVTLPGGLRAVDYGQVIGALVAAVNRLADRVEALEAR